MPRALTLTLLHAAKESAVFQYGLTLSGSGEIWDREDALIFRQQLTGDGWVQARVTDAEMTAQRSPSCRRGATA